MKPVIEIIRHEGSEQGTIGIMKIVKSLFCTTLEPRDRLNVPNNSCIPSGQYICRRIITEKFGETYEVQNVPGRSEIVFHAGNIARHTKGCILLGQYPAKLKGERAVLNSGETFRMFLHILADYPEIHLTITENY